MFEPKFKFIILFGIKVVQDKLLNKFQVAFGLGATATVMLVVALATPAVIIFGSIDAPVGTDTLTISQRVDDFDTIKIYVFVVMPSSAVTFIYAILSPKFNCKLLPVVSTVQAESLYFFHVAPVLTTRVTAIDVFELNTPARMVFDNIVAPAGTVELITSQLFDGAALTIINL